MSLQLVFGFLTQDDNYYINKQWQHIIDPREFGARYGYVDLLNFAIGKNWTWDTNLTIYAVFYGHLNVVKWVHQRNESKPDTLTTLKGHLHILKWALKHNFPKHDSLCYYAAYNGELRILKWLHKKGVVVNAGVFGWARRHGHLKVVHKNGWFSK